MTGGAGQAAVAADMGNNKFVAGTGSMDVTGGAGKAAYVFDSRTTFLVGACLPEHAAPQSMLSDGRFAMPRRPTLWPCRR
jgi:hypothetical protein